MKVYLGGAVWGIADPIVWRAQFAKKLPEGWEAVDPVKDGVFAGDINDVEGAQAVVSRDLKLIAGCDAFLALVNVPSWGTGMEIFFAHQLRIPIVAWNPGGKQMSAWLMAHCTIVTDFPGVKSFLQNLLVKT